MAGPLLVREVTPQLSLLAGVPRFTFVAEQSPELAATVIFVGQVSVCAWLSITVTVKVQALELPLASVAMLVTVVVPTGNADPLGGVETRLVTVQLSEALVVKVTTALHRPRLLVTTIFVEQTISGGWSSMTVTVNEQLLVLPASSVTTEVTVVVPTGKLEPLAGVETTVGVASQSSVAVTVKITLLLPHWPLSAFTTIGAGQLIAGALVSGNTVTLKVQLAVIPRASVTEHVTTVVPTANVEPDAGRHEGAPGTQSPVAVAAGKVIVAPPGVAQPCVTLPGQLTTRAGNATSPIAPA